jgi:hypothetical protein
MACTDCGFDTSAGMGRGTSSAVRRMTTPVGICISRSSFFMSRKNYRRGNSVRRGNPQFSEGRLGSFFLSLRKCGGKSADRSSSRSDLPAFTNRNFALGSVYGLKIGSLGESRASVSRVLRNGKECETPAEALVPGDLIELRRDEIVPADARVVTANRLTVNEAMLTGESVPAVKAP